MSLIDATYQLLYIKTTETSSSFLPIACLTDNSFSESADTIESFTKTQTGWKTTRPTNQSYNISFSGLDTTDTSGKASYIILQNAKRNRELIEWRIGTASAYYSGLGYITELNKDFPNDELITFNGSIVGSASAVIVEEVTSLVNVAITEMDFSGWTAVDSVLSINTLDVLSPIGNNTAAKMTSTDSTPPIDPVIRYSSGSITNANTYRFSVWARSGTENQVSLDIGDNGNNIIFDLTTDWKLISIEETPQTGKGFVDISLSNANVGEYIYIWNAVLTNGSTLIPLGALTDNIGVHLEWTASANAIPIDFYKVQVSVDGAAYSDLGTTTEVFYDAYISGDCSTSKTYDFKVIAVDINGNESEGVITTITTILC